MNKLVDQLRVIVLESDTKSGRYFDLIVQMTIIVSLVVFSIDTLPDLSSEIKILLERIEFVIVVLFLSEYVLRVFLTKKSSSYIFSFYGIVDLLAIIPYFLTGLVGSQTLRILRLFRLFGILKLTKYSEAITRIGKAISIAKEELILFSAFSLILLYLSALGIYYFEHAAQPENFRSIFDSLWWAVATLTTVGYGDVYPVTLGGRLFTFLVLVLGLGVVAVPTGIISSALSAVRKKAAINTKVKEIEK